MKKNQHGWWTTGIAVLAFLTAVSAVAEDASGDPVNARQVGAVGDGIADDTEALREALRLGAEQARPVYLPAGNYLLSDGLELKSGQKLQGAGMGVTVLEVPGEVAFDLLGIRDGENIHISHLSMKERDAANRARGHGLRIEGGSRGIVVESVATSGFLSGFAVGRERGDALSEGIVFRDCLAERARNFGFDIGNNRHLLIDNCRAFRNRLDGFKLRQHTVNVTIRGGESSHNGINGPNGNGVDAYAGGSSFIIDGLLSEWNNGSGLYVKTGPLSRRDFGDVGRMQIIGAISRFNRGSGLDINRSGGDLIKEGEVKQPPLLSYASVIGGLYEDNQASGIYVRGRLVTIQGAICRNNGQAGLDLASAWDVDVSGVIVAGNSTSGAGQYPGIRIGVDPVAGIARGVAVRGGIIVSFDDISLPTGRASDDVEHTQLQGIVLSETADQVTIDQVAFNGYPQVGPPVLINGEARRSVLVHYGIQPAPVGSGGPGSTLVSEGHLYLKTSPAGNTDGWRRVAFE